MRTITTSLILLVLVLIPDHLGSATYRNRQFVLISFNVSIGPQIRSKLNELESLFPTPQNSKADPIIACIKTRVWTMIELELESSTGMYILPVNAYSQFRYDDYGFPAEPINRALRRGSSRFYISADLSIEVEGQQGTVLGIGGRRSNADPEVEPLLLPKVTLTISLYNDKGVLPIDRFTASVTALNEFDFSSQSLNGLINGERHENPTTFYGLINQSIQAIVSNFKS